MKKRLVAMFLCLLVICTTAASLADFSFDTTNYSTFLYGESVQVPKNDSQWRVYFKDISGHGVGRAWIMNDTRYATNKYTYNDSYKGTTTAAKGYLSGVAENTWVTWKMRCDDDYKGKTFKAEGNFIP